MVESKTNIFLIISIVYIVYKCIFTWTRINSSGGGCGIIKSSIANSLGFDEVPICWLLPTLLYLLFNTYIQTYYIHIIYVFINYLGKNIIPIISLFLQIIVINLTLWTFSNIILRKNIQSFSFKFNQYY